MLQKPSSCSGCKLYDPPYGKHSGFSQVDGQGLGGVLLVGEALGESEEAAGVGFVGKAGYYLFSNLKRVDVERDQFWIFNAITCRPPNNKLAGQPYEEAAIAHCTPNLDQVIAQCRKQTERVGQHLTIVTLGNIPFKRVLHLQPRDSILKQDFYGYPFWSDDYKAWVLGAPHPSFLMRGNNYLLPVVQFIVKRALEIAQAGLVLDTPHYLLDPEPSTFAQWCNDYFQALKDDPDTILSYDIETPYKSGKREEELAKEDNEDYTILRCGFSYKPNEGASVRWSAEHRPMIEALFASHGQKTGWYNSGYDSPRVRYQMPINGDELDAMECWHILNTSMDKSLGFVTPFYVPTTGMWKHLSDKAPALYNMIDADMTLRNFLGIRKDLITNNLWKVYSRHVVELNRALTYMSVQGLNRDEALRHEAETKLEAVIDGLETQMEAAIPEPVKKYKVYKKTPKDTTGMVLLPSSLDIKVCQACGEEKPRKSHSKVCQGTVGKKAFPTKLWALPQKFKVSKVSLLAYQKSLRHHAIINRHENRVTFDEDALKQLIKRHPLDPLYPLIYQHRHHTKLLTTYVGVTQESGKIKGGMPIGKDGKGHPEFSHNPETLRLACPFFHTLPRETGVDELSDMIRNMIVASPGCLLAELDFSAIEAVLVGYFAGSADYIRLSKLGIHAFLASHVLGRPADLRWSDSDLKAYFKEIKKSSDPHVRAVYNSSKRTTHLSGYGGTPKKMHIAEPEAFPTIKEAEYLQGIYFEVCPYIKKWQQSVQLQAHKDGYLKNPFGYICRFNQVFSYEQAGGDWVRKPGEDANKVLAFLPQSTAAAIIKEAILRLYFNRFNEAGRWLRLQVHDSLLSDVPQDRLEEVLAVKREEMTRPIPELRLPASYQMGEMLTIGVDAKVGTKWGSVS